jgi:hypothetical protein
MHPNGRAADVVHTKASGSIFLNFITILMHAPAKSLLKGEKPAPSKMSFKLTPSLEGNGILDKGPFSPI